MNYLAYWKSKSESPKATKLYDVIIYCCIHIKFGLEFGNSVCFLCATESTTTPKKQFHKSFLTCQCIEISSGFSSAGSSKHFFARSLK